MYESKKLIDYITLQKQHLGASSITLYAEKNSHKYNLMNCMSEKQDITMVIKIDHKHVIAIYNKYCNSWIKHKHSKTHNNSKNFYLIGELDDDVFFNLELSNNNVSIHP
ncbi:hypothetical protein ABMZ87_08460 [Morganella morganii]|uniref:hypothetical protein n=1 Tax=Morganella morganii TaxID=582 RepID=UPI003EBA8EAC